MKTFRFRKGMTARIAAAAVLLFLVQTGTGYGGGCDCPICTGYAPAACPKPAFELVERTIYVPTKVTERRTVNMTEYRSEVRQRTVTFNRCIPEVREVRDVCTVLVPEVRARTQRFLVRKPVWREEEREVTVHMPHQEKRQAVRHVCRQVQVQEMRNVTRDQGHFEDVVCQDDCLTVNDCGGYGRGHRRWRRPCGGCGACGDCGYDAGCGKPVAQHVHRVWRPNLVTEQVPVQVWRNQMTEEPYEFMVTVYKPEVRKQKFRVCEFITEERSREVQFTVCVPQQRERVRQVTTYRMVPESREQTYTVHVPHIVSKEIDVTVCKMIPKQIVCRVPVACW